MATLIRADGSVKEINPKDGKKWSLPELRSYLGGIEQIFTGKRETTDVLVELVRVQNNQFLIVDEEGLMKELPYNDAASKVAHRPIVGNAILLKGEETLQ